MIHAYKKNQNSILLLNVIVVTTPHNHWVVLHTNTSLHVSLGYLC